MSSVDDIKAKYEAIKHSMHERGRRLWAAAEAISIGWGGVKAVHEATGIAQSTICAGKRELEEGHPDPRQECVEVGQAGLRLLRPSPDCSMR